MTGKYPRTLFTHSLHWILTENPYCLRYYCPSNGVSCFAPASTVRKRHQQRHLVSLYRLVRRCVVQNSKCQTHPQTSFGRNRLI